MEFLILIILVVVVASPILAIIALASQVRLRKRLGELEERVARVAARTPQEAPTPRSDRVEADPMIAPELSEGPFPFPFAIPTEQPVPPEPKSSEPVRELDLETLIAGRWMSVVGILALLLATAFFLKFAFDNNWVGPRGRVAIGLLSGTGLFAYSNWLSRKGYRYFSDGLAALGAGVLYLSLMAGWSFYDVFPLTAAFLGMIAVTATLVALSIGRDSQLLGVLGVIGGLLTPALLDTGRDAQVELFSYLAILSAGMLILGRRRRWISVEWLAFAGTLIHLAAWGAAHYSPDKLQSTLAFCVLFFIEFGAVAVWRVRIGETLGASEIAQTLVNAFWFLSALHLMLYDHHRWALTVAALAVSAFHLATANLTGAQRPAVRSRLLYAGLALTIATLAIAIRLEGRWITMAWAIEGGVLVWSGFKAKSKPMRGAGLLLLAVTAIRLLLLPIPGGRLLLNARFMAFAVTVASMGLALAGARPGSLKNMSRLETTVFAGVAVAINVLSVWALSKEVWDLLAGSRFAVDPRLAPQLGLSVLWTAYAAALVILGAVRRSGFLRWQGLTLLGIVVLKAFFYDLSFLQRAYRIISFLALGVLLLAVSYLYQRRTASAKDGKE